MMSLAWEVTRDDVETVCRAHGITDTAMIDLYVERVSSTNEHARIERAVLHYTALDDQTASALDEIETILLEAQLLTGQKQFAAPG